MSTHIRPLEDRDVDNVVALSVLAWEPIFNDWQPTLGSRLEPIATHPDWRTRQAEAVEKACRNEKCATWVAEVEGKVVGFVIYELNDAARTAEVYMLAVHPDYQSQGVGTDLNLFALQKMREAGMS